jgi:hypothetical protein
MTGGQDPVHDQAAGLLDDHRQVAGLAVTAQTAHSHLPARFGVRKRPPVQYATAVIDTVTSWPRLAQSQPT